MNTVSNTPMLLPKQAQESLLQYLLQCVTLTNTQWNLREQLLKMDLAYIRERDLTVANQRARTANTYGDADKFQNVTVPVVMPQVEAAVVYQSSVFLSGNPIFGVSAAPDKEDVALQMETVLENHQRMGGWVRQLQLAFRDGFKYNLAAVEVAWRTCVTPSFETDVTAGTQAKVKNVTWEGNTIRRLNLYNTFWDTRVDPANVHTDGEFAGYTELMSRIKLKKFINELPIKIIENIVPAFNSGMGATIGSNSITAGYYIPQINPEALLNKDPRATTNWMAWVNNTLDKNGAKIDYKNTYEVTTLYARLLPSDFGLRIPAAQTPQIFKLIIINHQVIIYAERQTNAHDYLPIIFSQPLEDGLGYQTKSLAANVEPMQAVTSALMNSNVHARRRAISDRLLYDPSRVAEHHINSDSPSARIPVRPAAYGKPLAEAVYQFPFRDEQSQINTQQIQQVLALADVASGHNRAQQGQFVKGNKTQSEYQDVMARANGRDQNVSLLLEDQFFQPIKYILMTNVLQYQGAGTLLNAAKNQQVVIDPTQLRETVLSFKVSDGLLPSDKLMDTDSLGTAFQVIGSSPAISSQYNVGPLFSYLMKLKHASISDFEKPQAQIAYEQAMQQWQNLVMQISQQAIKAGQQLDPSKFPPQPKPADYGYNPSPQSAAGGNGSPPPATQQSQPIVNANPGLQ